MQDHTFIITVTHDVYAATVLKAMRAGIGTNRAIEQALAEWSGLNKPLPIPVPFIITKIEEPKCPSL